MCFDWRPWAASFRHLLGWGHPKPPSWGGYTQGAWVPYCTPNNWNHFSALSEFTWRKKERLWYPSLGCNAMYSYCSAVHCSALQWNRRRISIAAEEGTIAVHCRIRIAAAEMGYDGGTVGIRRILGSILASVRHLLQIRSGWSANLDFLHQKVKQEPRKKTSRTSCWEKKKRKIKKICLKK